MTTSPRRRAARRARCAGWRCRSGRPAAVVDQLDGAQHPVAHPATLRRAPARAGHAMLRSACYRPASAVVTVECHAVDRSAHLPRMGARRRRRRHVAAPLPVPSRRARCSVHARRWRADARRRRRLDDRSRSTGRLLQRHRAAATTRRLGCRAGAHRALPPRRPRSGLPVERVAHARPARSGLAALWPPAAARPPAVGDESRRPARHSRTSTSAR